MSPKKQSSGQRPSPAHAIATSLEARIQARYRELPPSEQAVADLLLEHPGFLATHSNAELAALGGTSKAAITRCLKRLGYTNHAAARREVREARRWGSPLYLEPDESRAIAGNDLIATHLANDLENLARTFASLDDATIIEAVDAIARARRVVVIGFRDSHHLAAYARSRLRVLRDRVEIAPLAGETLGEVLAGLGGEDVVIGIGMRRRVPGFVRALAAAHENGARIAYLSDPGGAANAPFATWVWRCHSRGTARFDSYASAISVLNLLTGLVAHALGTSARRQLNAAERMLSRLGELA